MTDDHDHDHGLPTDDPTDRLPSSDDLEAGDPISTAVSVTPGEGVPRGGVAVAGGGLLLISALRSLARRQLRAIPKAVLGAGLVAYGLERRSSERDEGGRTFEPDTSAVSGETEGKAVSDQAHAARSRPDHGRTSETGPGGEVSSSSQLGENRADEETEIEFTDEPESGSKPDLEGEEDPRRDTGEDIEIDVSESAMADEPAEATGPDPEQAQPSQTDAGEPEETPAEDASQMKVDPEDEEETESEDDEDEASEE